MFEIRDLVAEVAPNAVEEIRYGGLVYFFAKAGSPVSAGICRIAIKPDHVRLYFTHGAFIPDSSQLLKVKGSGKAMRYRPLTNFESAPWEQIRVLIKDHAARWHYHPNRAHSSQLRQRGKRK